jgi:hypothetical protein
MATTKLAATLLLFAHAFRLDSQAKNTDVDILMDNKSLTGNNLSYESDCTKICTYNQYLPVCLEADPSRTNKKGMLCM